MSDEVVHLRILGGVDLRGPDGTEARSVLAQPKRLALLLYLATAMPRGFHRKDTLRALFWPESADGRARRALNRTVYYLRSALDRGVLVSRGDEEVAVAEDRMWCDAVEFERALAAGKLEDALGLYRGDLAPGFFVGRVPDFERWLESERHRLRERAVEAALALAEREEGDGRPAIAERWARQASALAPYNERAARWRIRLLDRMGDRASALRAYEELARRLHDDLEVEPSPELQTFVATIRSRRQPQLMVEPPSQEVVQLGEHLRGVTEGAEPAGRGRRTWLGQGLLAVAAFAVLAVAIFAWPNLVSREPEGSDGYSLNSIAVLPFTLIGDTAGAHVAQGLAEVVVTALVRIEGLQVPGASTVARTGARSESPVAIGRKLQVAMVLTGSVQVAGQRLRVTARLIRVVDGVTAWSDQYDGEMVDIFAIEDSITGRVLETLKSPLGPRGRTAVAGGVRTRDPVAYDLYLRGRRATYELTRPSIERAITLFQQAVGRDSTFADAWVALGDAYGWYAKYLPSADVAVSYRRALERGIELDSANGLAFALRGELRTMHDWDWDGAARDYRRALRLAPASADVALSHAVFLDLVSEPDSAVMEMRRAVAIDPISSVMWANLGTRFAIAGMGDSALAASRHALALDSTQWIAYIVQMHLYLDVGRRADAEWAATRMLQLAGDSPHVLALVSAYYRRAGDRAGAREMLSRLTALADRQYVPATYFAQARLAVGDRAGALDALEEAARNRDLELPVDLLLVHAPLSGEPRYEAVCRTVFGHRPVGWHTFR